MITLDLAAEHEIYLQQQAAARGVSADRFATEVLAHYCALLQPKPVEEHTRTRRDEAVERMIRTASAPDAPTLDLPEGGTLRAYIHEGHRH